MHDGLVLYISLKILKEIVKYTNKIVSLIVYISIVICLLSMFVGIGDLYK